MTEPGVPVRVASVADLARMAGAAAARMAFMPIYVFEENRRTVLFVQTIFKDYYKLYGLPVIYYYVAREGEIPRDAGYIAVKAEDGEEKVEFVRAPRPGWIAIPLVRLAERPGFVPDVTGGGEGGSQKS